MYFVEVLIRKDSGTIIGKSKFRLIIKKALSVNNIAHFLWIKGLLALNSRLIKDELIV